MATCMATLGAPRNELNAMVIVPPAISTIQTMAGTVTSAANRRSCLASCSRAKDCRISAWKLACAVSDGWMRNVSNKTTIIILGDARGNRTDPRTEIMQRLSQRAKRIIWLNPEFRSAWGTGDSDMFRYKPYCNVVTVCNTLRHLERVVSDLLKDAA